jgi:hypothetical protein
MEILIQNKAGRTKVEEKHIKLEETVKDDHTYHLNEQKEMM